MKHAKIVTHGGSIESVRDYSWLFCNIIADFSKGTQKNHMSWMVSFSASRLRCHRLETLSSYSKREIFREFLHPDQKFDKVHLNYKQATTAFSDSLSKLLIHKLGSNSKLYR